MDVLVVAEKPSVARDLSSVLGRGPVRKTSACIEREGLRFAWCLGHLTGPDSPEKYKAEWERWGFRCLPMVPRDFEFTSSPRDARTASHLAQVVRLIRSSRVVVNACDAGREGELIFWEAMRASGWGTKEPGEPGAGLVERLWLRTMTPEGIRDAWESRSPIGRYAQLAKAAYTRQQADWLLGMNLTRAATLALPEREDTARFWPVGRVQTPVLAEIVRRDATVSDFVPSDFFGVDVVFAEGALSTRARLEVPESLRLGDDPHRFKDRAAAEKYQELVVTSRETLWSVAENGRTKQEAPPRLFSLTSLQREASKRFGWSAKETLEIAQGLYEGGYLTYPRTDSEYLPGDAQEMADGVMRSLEGWLRFATKGASSIVVPSASTQQELFDSKKVSDHFAIVPTTKELRDGEVSDQARELWNLVVSRFVTAFHSDAEVRFAERTYSAAIAGKPVKALAKGRSTLVPGWRGVAELLEAVRPPKEVVLGELVDPSHLVEAEVSSGCTKAPPRHTEASLLGAMEKCGRMLEGAQEVGTKEELLNLQKLLKDRGLGTSATRAEIIEGLIGRKLVERVGTGKKIHLRATRSGMALISELKRAKLPELTLPGTTAAWEKGLRLIEQGEGERKAFLSGLVGQLEEMVGRLRPLYDAKSASLADEHGTPRCPKSGKPVEVAGRGYLFPGYPQVVCPRRVAQREMKPAEYLETLRAHEKGEPGPLFEGFVSRKGHPFSARLRLEGARFRFRFQDQEEDASELAVRCPKSARPVRDFGTYLVFPGWPEVRCWKEVAKRGITAKEYQAVFAALTKGEGTPCFDGFRSRKGKRFSARFCLSGNRLTFEYE